MALDISEIAGRMANPMVTYKENVEEDMPQLIDEVSRLRETISTIERMHGPMKRDYPFTTGTAREGIEHSPYCRECGWNVSYPCETTKALGVEIQPVVYREEWSSLLKHAMLENDMRMLARLLKDKKLR